MYPLIAIAAGLSLLTTLTSASPHYNNGLLERQAATTCNRDNLYRCFTASQAVASPFCASVVAPVTVTASPTLTPSSSVTTTTTVTVTATSQNPGTTTCISFIYPGAVTSTSTVVISTTSSTTTTVASHTLLNKRDEPSPACLTRDGVASTSYPASRISSACLCLSYASTTTVTPNLGTVTYTSTVTTTPAASFSATTTVAVYSSVSASTTVVVTTTTTAVSVSTSVVVNSTAFVKVHESERTNTGCWYQRWREDDPDVPTDPGPDRKYTKGTEYCAAQCATRSWCQSFFFWNEKASDRKRYPNGTSVCIIDGDLFRHGSTRRDSGPNNPPIKFSAAYDRVAEGEPIGPKKIWGCWYNNS